MAWLGSMTVVGSYAIAHAIYRAVVASKKAGLESLVERLADHCGEVAE